MATKVAEDFDDAAFDLRTTNCSTSMSSCSDGSASEFSMEGPLPGDGVDDSNPHAVVNLARRVARLEELIGVRPVQSSELNACQRMIGRLAEQQSSTLDAMRRDVEAQAALVASLRRDAEELSASVQREVETLRHDGALLSTQLEGKIVEVATAAAVGALAAGIKGGSEASNGSAAMVAALVKNKELPWSRADSDQSTTASTIFPGDYDTFDSCTEATTGTESRDLLQDAAMVPMRPPTAAEGPRRPMRRVPALRGAVGATSSLREESIAEAA